MSFIVIQQTLKFDSSGDERLNETFLTVNGKSAEGNLSMWMNKYADTHQLTSNTQSSAVAAKRVLVTNTVILSLKPATISFL
jgi:hypothetical protein